MPTISITVISDPVCPWCFIGALRLSRAITLYLKTVCSSDTIRTKWHAYQLDADTPTQPLVSKIASKWGIDQVPAVKTRLNSIAKREGLEFNFDSTIGNTRDAHRLEKLGRKNGLEMEVAIEIMRMYFLQGGDITSKEDLVGAAEKVGIDKDGAKEWLESDEGGEEVDAEVDEMQRLGVRGVPRYIINDKFAIDGAEDVGDILEKLVMAREEALAQESSAGM
jgi:predicted DsbA family dithiol-disulfide isomerase